MWSSPHPSLPALGRLPESADMRPLRLVQALNGGRVECIYSASVRSTSPFLHDL